MFTFSEMLVLVQSESSFGAFVFHRRPAGLHATSDLVTTAPGGLTPEFYKRFIDDLLTHNWVNDLQFLTRILTKFLKGFY